MNKYSIKYDNNSTEWMSDNKYNMAFVHLQEQYFNDVLANTGYVFLKDIYDSFGIDITKESITVGWHIKRDSSVKFEIIEKADCIILRFNIKGDITQYFN